MCLIVNKPAGYSLQKRAMRFAFHNNPDGFGISSFIPGEFFRLDTGITESFDEFWETAYQYSDLHQVIHLRYATVGQVSNKLIHPFEIIPNVYLFHNGTLKDFSHIPEGESDTSWFVQTVLRPEFKKNPECFLDKKWVEKLAGGINGGRMIILRTDGKKAIINKYYGYQYGSIWFSNFNYLGSKVKRAEAKEPVMDYENLFD